MSSDTLSVAGALDTVRRWGMGEGPRPRSIRMATAALVEVKNAVLREDDPPWSAMPVPIIGIPCVIDATVPPGCATVDWPE